MPTDVDLFDAALDKFKADNPESTIPELHAFEFGFDAAVSAIRAQADAQAVATVMRNQVLCWLPGAPKLTEGTDLFTRPASEAAQVGLSDAPRYAEWRHLVEHGQWTYGVPTWARDHEGRMNDVTAMRAVIEELATLITRASAATASPDARIEELRKSLFEARDAMRVMSNWVKQSDPAGYSWGVRMVDRANAVLSGASAATVAEPSEQFEHLDLQNHQLRRAVQKIMARLTELLDEDKFAEIEAIAKGAGVEPPKAAQQQAEPGADERLPLDEWHQIAQEDRSAWPARHVRQLINRIRALEAAQSGQRAGVAEGWQPIETAPKTGCTLLLGYPNSLGNWRTTRGQWMSEEYIAENWEDPEDVEPGWFETSVEADDLPNCWCIEPTHWMPLPAAPTQQQEGA